MYKTYIMKTITFYCQVPKRIEQMERNGFSQGCIREANPLLVMESKGFVKELDHPMMGTS